MKMKTKKIKILSIEKKTFASDLFRSNMKSLGVWVHPVSSAKELKEVLKVESFDAVIIQLDSISMKKNSWTLDKIFPLLAQNEHTHALPSIIASIVEPQLVKEYLKAMGVSVDSILHQPFPAKLLLENIKTLLNKKIRAEERLALSGHVKVSLDGVHSWAFFGDLSLSGAFLFSNYALQIGRIIRIEWKLPKNNQTLRVDAEIKRSLSHETLKRELGPGSPAPHGWGVEFLSFQAGSDKLLRKFLESRQQEGSSLSFYH
ncbi:MAG: PilZ domain-containing protein [Oligoflexales bacterium]|nr:PilZ domain-containing protein [Oligoflexales bacterium]